MTFWIFLALLAAVFAGGCIIGGGAVYIYMDRRYSLDVPDPDADSAGTTASGHQESSGGGRAVANGQPADVPGRAVPAQPVAARPGRTNAPGGVDSPGRDRPAHGAWRVKAAAVDPLLEHTPLPDSWESPTEEFGRLELRMAELGPLVAARIAADELAVAELLASGALAVADWLPVGV